jgi:hypothetical protein
MSKEVVKDLIVGGVSELMRNPHLYYFSSVGPNYCHWTEDGKAALHEYMNLMAWKLREAEEAELNQRAKDLVLKELKS